jgi:predicted nuclease with TOPRIM domain
VDSPFQDIVGTNFVPSDKECQRIRDFLEDAQKEVTDLTEELARLDALRKELSRKWQQLKEFIDAHLALVSPVRRLPEDIIRSIFVASLPLHRNPTISGQEAPLLLGQI